MEDAAQRLHRLEQQLAAIVPSWSMAQIVAGYQAMRGASFLVAVTFAAEIGDVRRRAASRDCRRRCVTSPGKRSSDCVPGIVGSGTEAGHWQYAVEFEPQTKETTETRMAEKHGTTCCYSPSR